MPTIKAVFDRLSHVDVLTKSSLEMPEDGSEELRT